jgi:DEAD/DEAH box helicase
MSIDAVTHPKDQLDALLRGLLGPDAQFRPGQREAIEAIALDGARALVVQRTGWGKSLVYWIATRLRRDAGHGPTLLISPLLSLMRNQIAAAERIGVRAVTIHSGNRDEWETARQVIRDGTCDVLLISPERDRQLGLWALDAPRRHELVIVGRSSLTSWAVFLALARFFGQAQDRSAITRHWGSKMRRMRGRMVRGLVLWTLLLLVVAVLLAVQAMGSLYGAGQACFFNYPSVPCPGADDPALARLTFAFFGVPLVWLLGIGVAVLGRALRRRRSTRPR